MLVALRDRIIGDGGAYNVMPWTALVEPMGAAGTITSVYDIPNLRLASVQIDIYSTYRDEQGAAQRCIISTTCDRATATDIDWDAQDPEDIVRAFGDRLVRRHESLEGIWKQIADKRQGTQAFSFAEQRFIGIDHRRAERSRLER